MYYILATIIIIIIMKTIYLLYEYYDSITVFWVDEHDGRRTLLPELVISISSFTQHC